MRETLARKDLPMSKPAEHRRPNILLVMTDQLRSPPAYESEELAAFRKEHCAGQERLRANGISFRYHYPITAACAPSRASLLTGHHPSLHGVSQTDGLTKSADGDDMFWLASDGVPTMGDWFRAGGYRTYYKGKWHASHAHLDADDGDGYLLSINDEGEPQQQNIDRYLEADLLDPYGFAEWVGPEPHGLGKHNTGTIKDVYTADETVELLQRLDGDESDQPWLAVCSFLNPHDDSMFGVIALAQGLRYHPSTVPHAERPPTHDEDLSTKPTCQQSMVDLWGTILAPQPWIETHRKFYYQLQATVDEQITKVLDALEASSAYENTIVVFTSDHGDLQGAHNGMHEKWHVAYEEAIHVPFVVSSPLLPGGARELDIPTSHADLIPTLLGLAGIDPDAALTKLTDHKEIRPLIGRDLSDTIRAAEPTAPSEPILFTTDDEISEGNEAPASPFQKAARLFHRSGTIKQPNHLETVIAEVDVDGARHLVKLTRYHDNQQFWTVPGQHDERIHHTKTFTVTEPEPDEYELYDLTIDPYEQRNLAHPTHADDHSRSLQAHMHELLVQQLAKKRLVPGAGETPGYRPPTAPANGGA
jgi:arylsulfatase A-like enzyme